MELTEQRTIERANPATNVGIDAREPIPGYVLEEKLGAGGYGEVWRASAPGGLLKAVKLVYGSLDETRAASELKAMERVKGVRHPFILTMERIEVVNGRLIVVTELAEESLRDRFSRCVDENLIGIPRDVLMRYLRDVADALDYMFEKHSLQHLDIKPENLLVVGDHVKVADFGLTKDLDDVSMSVVAGMTPLYAAPEVLEGKPGQFSDQYSMAIVYQYLLTGRYPFRGRTAAQLISQHLHSAPELSELPSAEQSVVAKALSKKPNRRFGSCREFVDQLIQSETGPDETKGTKPKRKRATRQDGNADSAADRPLDPAAIRIEPLPPLNVLEVERIARPTLVVGIGGVAGKVLCGLKQRLTENGEGQLPPATRLLYLDVDETAISKSLSSAHGAALNRDETLAFPLKPSSAYHKRTQSLVKWISRRWLFNIPRSQQTEGIRALGRLAFVDSARSICKRLGEVLSDITSDEQVAALEQSARMPVERQVPRVLMLATSTGGTGSGCLVDAAYAVRHGLRERKLGDAHLSGLFLQAAPEGGSQSLVRSANGITCLRELDYYNRATYYDGEASLGIGDFDFTPPFGHTYVVPLGHAMTAEEFDASAEYAADYLFRNVAAETAACFDFSRSQPNAAGGQLAVRSFAAEFQARGLATATGRTALAAKKLLATRGQSRLLLGGTVNPVEIDAIEAEFGIQPAILPTDRSAFACYEIENIPIRDITALLEASTPDALKITDRLYTRIDLGWS